MKKGNDKIKIASNIQKYERGLTEEEKRTLSIRLTDESGIELLRNIYGLLKLLCVIRYKLICTAQKDCFHRSDATTS